MDPSGRRERWRRRGAAAACVGLLAWFGWLAARWSGSGVEEDPAEVALGRAQPAASRGAGSASRDADAVERVDTPEASDEGPTPLRTVPATLDNGLTLWVIEDHNAPIVAARVVFRVGSVDDPPGRDGLAHLVEHMMFRGTAHLGTTDWGSERGLLADEQRWIAAMADRPNARDALAPALEAAGTARSRFDATNDLARLLASLGATDVNALTATEHTWFQATLPANELRPWAVAMAEALSAPVFRGFDRERAIVGWEAAQGRHRQANEDLMRALFADHPYGRATIGSTATLAAADTDDAVALHRAGYGPENAAVVLVGDVTPAEARAVVERTFGEWTPSRAPPRRAPPPVRRFQRGLRVPPVDTISSTVAWALPAHTAPEVLAVLGVALRAELTRSDVAPLGVGSIRWSSGGLLHVRCLTTGDACERDAVAAARTIARDGAPPGLIRWAARAAWVDELRALESAQARADELVNAWARGEPAGEAWAWRTRIRSVAPSAVADAARTWLQGYVVAPLGPVARGASDEPPASPPSAADPDARSAFADEVLAIPVPELAPAWRTPGEDWTEAAGGAVIAARNPVNTLFQAEVSWPLGWRDDPLVCAALRAWVSRASTRDALAPSAVRVSADCAWDTASMTMYGPEAYAAIALSAAWPRPDPDLATERTLPFLQRYAAEPSWWLLFGRPQVRTDARTVDELNAALVRLVDQPARLLYSGAAPADTVAGWIRGPADARALLEPVSWTETVVSGDRGGMGLTVVRPSEPFDPEREGLYALYESWLAGFTGTVATELRHRRSAVYGARVSYPRGRRVGEPNALMVELPTARDSEVALTLDAVLRGSRLTDAAWAELRDGALANAWSSWVPFRELPAAGSAWAGQRLGTDVHELRYAQIQDVDRETFERFAAAEADRPARWYVEGHAYDRAALAAIGALETALP